MVCLALCLVSVPWRWWGRSFWQHCEWRSSLSQVPECWLAGHHEKGEFMSTYWHFIGYKFDGIFTNHVSTGPNKIASIRLSVRLFPLYLSNRLTFGLDLLRVCGSLPWLTGDWTEGHRSRSRCAWSDLDCRSRTVFTHATLLVRVLAVVIYLSITRWYCVTMAEHRIMESTTHDSPQDSSFLVSKVLVKFKQGYLKRGCQMQVGVG